MYPFIILGLLLLVFLVIPFVLVLIVRKLSKKFGYIKTGKILSYSIIVGFVILFLFTFFENAFFFKNDAIKIVAEQGIKLSDNCEMLENKSSSIFDDYYKTFALKISSSDKNSIISKIKNSPDFIPLTKARPDISSLTDRYFGKKVSQNYEEDFQFVTESFEPNGKQNYAPTHRKISIDKKENKLIYEDLE